MRDLEDWEVGGSAMVHRNFVRLTGEKQSQKGWLAARAPMSATEWSALLELRASGNSMHLYGDGAQSALSQAPVRSARTRERRRARAQASPSGSFRTRITSRGPSSAEKITGPVSARGILGGTRCARP